MRDRLRKWCENGLARITDDAEQLQMHKSVRNITRLFERIQDFEKRVVERRGQLGRADAEAQLAALALLARTLAAVRPARRRGAAGGDPGSRTSAAALRRPLAGVGGDPGRTGEPCACLLTNLGTRSDSIEQSSLDCYTSVCYECTCRAINR